MNKSLCGGSVAVVVALLLAYLIPSANSLIAQNRSATQRTSQDYSNKDNQDADAKRIVGSSHHFEATAYSLRGRTTSGKMTQRGVIAADRKVLPIGTRVRLEAGDYSGEYLVADSGGAVRGHKIDIWVPQTREALNFGRRKVKLTILHYKGGKASSSTSATSLKR